METKNSLRELLRAEARKNKNNNYTDNRDYGVIGGNPAPANYKSKLRSIQLKLRSAGSKILPSEFFYNFLIDYLLKNHLEGLSFLYNCLADDYSKNLLVRVLTFRVMGYEKYKLPLSNKAYWDNLKLAETLIVDKDNFIDPKFLGFVLYKHDLRPIGFPITFYFTSLGVLIDFIILQYVYRQKDVVIKAEKDDVVIDAGGCWGDTALLFSSEVGTGGKIYSFEFIPSNIEIYKKNLALNPHLSDAVKIVPHPVWETSEEKLYFNDCGPASTVSVEKTETHSGEATTLSIDDFVKREGLSKVNFIKMDIEGAEPPSVRGATETIKKFKPKLAIAVYHDLSDFYTITRYLDSLNLGYKFYLQHATIYSGETVLFARVEDVVEVLYDKCHASLSSAA